MNNQMLLSVVVKQHEIDNSINDYLLDLIAEKKAKVKGFRPEDVTLEVAREHLASGVEQDLVKKIVQKHINDAVIQRGYSDAFYKSRVLHVDTTQDERTYWVAVGYVASATSDTIATLPSIKRVNIELSEEDVQHRFTMTTLQHSQWTKSDTVARHSFVRFVILNTDVPHLQSRLLQTTECIVGSGSILYALEEQLVGKVAKELCTLDINGKKVGLVISNIYHPNTIPQTDADLAGKGIADTVVQCKEKIRAELLLFKNKVQYASEQNAVLASIRESYAKDLSPILVDNAQEKDIQQVEKELEALHVSRIFSYVMTQIPQEFDSTAAESLYDSSHKVSKDQFVLEYRCIQWLLQNASTHEVKFDSLKSFIINF